MKQFFILVISIACIGFLFIYSLLNFPFFSEKLIPFIVNTYYHEKIIKNLSIDSQHISKSGLLEFKKINMIIYIKKTDVPISIDKCTVKNLFHINQYSKDRKFFEVMVDDCVLDLKKIQMNGIITSQIVYQYGKKTFYEIQAKALDAELSNLQTLLKKDWFSKISGPVNGDVKITKNFDDNYLINFSFFGTKNILIKTSLLNLLFSQLPEKIITDNIKALLEEDKFVVFESSNISITNLDDEKIGVNIKLNSAELNINLDLKFDVNVDGGFMGFLKNLEIFNQGE